MALRLLFDVLLPALLCLPGLYLLHLLFTSLLDLRKNYQAAKTIGLEGGARPILTPVYEVNFLYKLTLPLHEPIIRFFGLADSLYWQLFFMDWCFKTRHDQFKQRGTDIITTVSPLRTVLTTANAEVAYQLGSRFEKPVHLYSRVSFMGENVVASEGAQWRRLRKILQRPFNEAVMSTVWQATLDQSIPLRKKWCDAAEEGVNVERDIPRMALGVLCGAGFGVTIPFDSDGKQELPPGDEFFASSTPTPGFHFNFGDVLAFLLSNIVTVLATKALLPAWLLRHGPVPRKWKNGAKALEETRNYIQKLVDRERRRNETAYYQQEGHHSNLLTILTNPESSGGLTEDEQIANTFIMVLAGHETSAGILRYSLVLLALFEDKQDWFLKELDQALAGIEPEDWTYDKLFPRLSCCLCIMNEALRLFPGVPVLPKWCPTPTTLKYNQKILHIPAGTMINISLPALQQNPKYFGAKSYEFRPEVWDARSSTGWTEETSNQPIDEGMALPYRYIRKPIPGSYVPFSEGRRACLGKKFAQIEFCLVLAILFQKHRVKLVLKPGESKDAAKARCWRVLRGSLSLLSLQMQEQVPVKWVRR